MVLQNPTNLCHFFSTDEIIKFIEEFPDDIDIYDAELIHKWCVKFDHLDVLKALYRCTDFNFMPVRR